MNGELLKKTVVITNPQGFHMRPATKFAKTAGQFQSTVKVIRGDRTADGRSLLDMMANVMCLAGEELTVEVAGPDAPAALDALVAVMLAPTEPE
jgi:phosphotransferase system HPr (HPr) family protein